MPNTNPPVLHAQVDENKQRIDALEKQMQEIQKLRKELQAPSTTEVERQKLEKELFLQERGFNLRMEQAKQLKSRFTESGKKSIDNLETVFDSFRGLLHRDKTVPPTKVVVDQPHQTPDALPTVAPRHIPVVAQPIHQQTPSHIPVVAQPIHQQTQSHKPVVAQPMQQTPSHKPVVAQPMQQTPSHKSVVVAQPMQQTPSHIPVGTPIHQPTSPVDTRIPAGKMTTEETLKIVDAMLSDHMPETDEALQSFISNCDTNAIKDCEKNFELMQKLRALRPGESMEVRVLHFIRDNNAFRKYFNNKKQIIAEEIHHHKQVVNSPTNEDTTSTDVFNKSLQSDIIRRLEKEKKYYTGLEQQLVFMSSVGELGTGYVVDNLFDPPPEDEGILLTNKAKTKAFIVQLAKRGNRGNRAKLYALLSYFVSTIPKKDDTPDPANANSSREMVVFMRKQILKHNLAHVGERRKRTLTPDDTSALMAILHSANTSLSQSLQSVHSGSQSMLSKFSALFRTNDETTLPFDQTEFNRLVELTAYLDTTTDSIDEFEDYIFATHHQLLVKLRNTPSTSSQATRKSTRTSTRQSAHQKSEYFYAQGYIRDVIEDMRQLIQDHYIKWEQIVSTEFIEGESWEHIRKLRLMHNTLKTLNEESLKQAIEKKKDEEHLKNSRTSRRQIGWRRSKRLKKKTTEFFTELVDDTRESDDLINKYKEIITQLEEQSKAVNNEIDRKTEQVKAEIKKRGYRFRYLTPDHIESFRRWRNLQYRKISDIKIDIDATQQRIRFETQQQKEAIEVILRQPLFGSTKHSSYNQYANSNDVKHCEVIWHTFLEDYNEPKNEFKKAPEKAKYIDHALINTDTAILQLSRNTGGFLEISPTDENTQRKQPLRIKIADYKSKKYPIEDDDCWFVIIILEAYKPIARMLGKPTINSKDSRYYISVLESRKQNVEEASTDEPTIYTYFISDKNIVNGIDFETLNLAIKEDTNGGIQERRSRRRFSGKKTGIVFKKKSFKHSIIRDFTTYKGIDYILKSLIKLQGNGKDVLVDVKSYPMITRANQNTARQSRNVNDSVSKNMKI
jgi:glycosyltransferase involved in cell wall biosynthesis